MGHRYVYPGLVGGRQGFIVLAQPAAPASQDRVPSTTHLRVNTPKLCLSGRLTISKVQPVSADTQPISFPAYPPSAQSRGGRPPAPTSRDLLAGIVAPRSPFSVVFTDWLSIIAAPSRRGGRLPAPTRSARAANHRRHPPGTARSQYVQNAVDQPSAGPRSGAVLRVWLGEAAETEYSIVRRSGRWGMACDSSSQLNAIIQTSETPS